MPDGDGGPLETHRLVDNAVWPAGPLKVFDVGQQRRAGKLRFRGERYRTPHEVMVAQLLDKMGVRFTPNVSFFMKDDDGTRVQFVPDFVFNKRAFVWYGSKGRKPILIHGIEAKSRSHRELALPWGYGTGLVPAAAERAVVVPEAPRIILPDAPALATEDAAQLVTEQAVELNPETLRPRKFGCAFPERAWKRVRLLKERTGINILLLSNDAIVRYADIGHLPMEPFDAGHGVPEFVRAFSTDPLDRVPKIMRKREPKDGYARKRVIPCRQR